MKKAGAKSGIDYSKRNIYSSYEKSKEKMIKAGRLRPD
jgi:hypothetical protein